MKKTSNVIVTLLTTLLLLLSIFQVPVKAAEDTESVVLKKNDGYMLYYKSVCDSEFEFAFSKDSGADENSLGFTNSVKDQLEGDALNVAYVDESIYNNYFTPEGKAYIWIRNAEGEMKEAGLEVDLSNFVTDEMTEKVSTTTKRIKTIETEENVEYRTNNNVNQTVTVGKVDITDDKEAKYYYQIVKVTESTPELNELFNLAEEIANDVEGTYDSLAITKEFYDLYNSQEPAVDDSNWKEVNNFSVLQPEDTQTGDRYIVWLKKVDGTETVRDAKFLKSKHDYIPTYVTEEDKIVTETVKLPVTYDSIVLIVAFAAIVVAIIVLVVLKNRTNKKETNKK